MGDWFPCFQGTKEGLSVLALTVPKQFQFKIIHMPLRSIWRQLVLGPYKDIIWISTASSLGGFTGLFVQEDKNSYFLIQQFSWLVTQSFDLFYLFSIRKKLTFIVYTFSFHKKKCILITHKKILSISAIFYETFLHILNNQLIQVTVQLMWERSYFLCLQFLHCEKY